MKRNFFWGLYNSNAVRDRVNNREDPGTVLPRAHPNAGTGGDAAENGPLEAF